MHCVRAHMVRIFFIILVRACAGEHMGHAHSDYAGSHIKPKPVSVLSCDSPADTHMRMTVHLARVRACI